MPFVRALLSAAALLIAAPALSALGAQQADVIRGRITTTDGAPIENATVVAASIPGNVSRTARTDRSGRYAITFVGAEGDYWLNVSAIGFTPRRFELKRVADEEILIGDAKLVAAGVVLEAVRVQGDRARPGRNESTDVSGTEKSVSAVADPSQAGNLAAMAAGLPGVQLVPGADGNADQFSVFGLSGDQNNATLNGFGFGGADIPRDAAMRASLGPTPWDVSRGGFSGGQIGLMTQSGSNFSSRGMSTLLNAPSFQWTDRAGRALGAEFTSISLGAATAGPIAMDRTFYSIGYQFDRRVSDLSNLLTANPLALRLAGVAPDSVARLRDIVGGTGVPASVTGLPPSRLNDRALLLAAFDFAPQSSTNGQALNITIAGTLNQRSAPLAQVTAFPTNDVRGTDWFGAMQGRHTTYFGFGMLSETSAGVSRSRTATDPYLALPNAGVRVVSALDDGSAAIAGLTFGGSPMQATRAMTTGLGAQNQLSWFTADNKHRLILTTALRYETFTQDVTLNSLGSFRYNSLADLEANQPASFTRTLSPQVRSGRQLQGSVALGDSYRPIADLQLQYGVRVDGNRFLSSPPANPLLRQAFGADNTVLPSRVYVSPRVGFSWTYGLAPQLPIASGFMRGPRAVVRGGLGLFQNAPAVQLIGGAVVNTGLPEAVQQLTCFGSAVPVPDWEAYRADADAIPRTCADGTVFANSSPDVVLFDPGYAAPRSVRANLNWSGATFGSRAVATLDATYSLNLAQPGLANLNFRPVERFALADEAGRPVYVQATSIVPATGAVAPDDARLVPTLGSVIQQRSDRSSVSRQFSVSLRPLAFSSRYSWSFGYVYANTRDVSGGFSSTAGDPRIRDWSRAAMDSRHQILYSLSYNFFDWLPVSWSGSFRSGRPFTPSVAGDMNGDGFANDRAFIFDPARAGDPAIADGMRALVERGSASARRCLSRQIGRVASRNSCEGPWTSTSSLTIAVNPVKFRLPQRMNVSFFVNNALGAADVLLDGESGRRGWGQSVLPDPTLLFVRGFDPSTRRFRYEVNPRFGATALSQTINRNPVVITAQVRLDVGFTRERQLLTQSLDRGRGRPGRKPSDQEIRAMSGALIPPNPMALILQQSDSLRLTRQQADSIAALNRVYAVSFDTIWTPVARYLAALPERYERAPAYERYRQAREASIDILIGLAPHVRGVLTPGQLRALPAMVTTSLDTRYLASVRSSTAGGANLGALGMLAQMGWMGGTVDASANTVMLHR